MVTMASLQTLAYPGTVMPAVAGPEQRRNVLLVESERGHEGIAVRPLLLCQDWDQRVVIHWQDDHRSYTCTVLDVVADSEERFEFIRGEEPSEHVSLTPLSYERFEQELRQLDPEAGGGSRFHSDEQFRRWFLSR